MAAKQYQVVITASAFDDLREIAEYWIEHDEPERGEKYTSDLFEEAMSQLRQPDIARAGRFLKTSGFPGAQEILVFKRSYRIIYFLQQEDGEVEVIRFWHSHRDEPFND